MSNAGNYEFSFSARVGGSLFRIRASERGICRLVLPRMTGDIILQKEVTIDRPKGYVWMVREGLIEELEVFLRRVLGGEKPLKVPLLDMREIQGFDRKVLMEVSRIGWGGTRTYGWIAARIGSPRAARAVGSALGRNPLPLLVPCHRVVRSDGVIGGFSAGRDWKEWLLGLEKGEETRSGSRAWLAISSGKRPALDRKGDETWRYS